MRATQPAVNVQQQLFARGRLAIGMSIAGMALALTGWLIGAIGYQHVGMPIFMTGWGMASGAVAFLGAFEQLGLLRLMQDLPTARIGSAHQGYVELQGLVCQSKEFIVCPKCNEPCLWFQCTQRKNKMVTPKGRTPDIVLDDDTGHCLVRAVGAELYAPGGYDRGHVHIKPGDWLHVLGEFRSLSTVTTPGADTPEQKSALRERLQTLKRDSRRLALFDRNKDGAVDSREWEAAVKATRLQLAREPAAPEAWRPDHVMGKPTTEADRLPFVIFVGTEEEAIARARKEFVWRLILAFLFGTIAVVFIALAPVAKP